MNIVTNNGGFYAIAKIDNHNIDLEYNNTSCIKIWISYNNNSSCTWILYDLKQKTWNANNIKRILTARQEKMLYKILTKFTNELLKELYNKNYRSKFILSNEDLDNWDRTVNKFAIKEVIG